MITGPKRRLDPGRLTRAAIHCDADEVELRLSAAGNWQLTIRRDEDREWQLACSGDLQPVRSHLLLRRPGARCGSARSCSISIPAKFRRPAAR